VGGQHKATRIYECTLSLPVGSLRRAFRACRRRPGIDAVCCACCRHLYFSACDLPASNNEIRKAGRNCSRPETVSGRRRLPATSTGSPQRPAACSATPIRTTVTAEELVRIRNGSQVTRGNRIVSQRFGTDFAAPLTTVITPPTRCRKPEEISADIKISQDL